MRTFVVWVEHLETEVEMPDDASEFDCEAACESAFDELMDRIDAGWEETTDLNEVKENK